MTNGFTSAYTYVPNVKSVTRYQQ